MICELSVDTRRHFFGAQPTLHAEYPPCAAPRIRGSN
jgi:hypothetical protein